MEILKFYPVLIVIGITLIGFYLAFISSKEWLRKKFSARNTVEKLVTSIIKKMNDDGYECQKKDGVLTYLLNGRVYRAYIQKTGANNFRLEVVDYLTIDEEWDKISIEGKSVLANYVNNNCQYTTFVSTENGVMCGFVGAINSSADFMEQAKLSYRMIGEAIETANNVLPDIRRQYPVVEQKNHIGFNNNKQ